jgi:cobalt-precorrin-5B (C1)-methyltransferase
MIMKEVTEVLPADQGVRLTVEVPKGKKVAQKTLNPKLGIKGGISILGTTGIVEPMSKEAYRRSLALKIDQALAENFKKIVLIFGNYGKKLARELDFQEGQIIRMSNFVGYMLEQCEKKGVKNIVLIGHIGKLVKVSAGIFDTHSRKADARLETIAAYTASLGGSKKLINNILAANTAEETVSLIKKNNERVFDLLAERAALRSAEYTERTLKIDSIIFSLTDGVLGKYERGDVDYE